MKNLKIGDKIRSMFGPRQLPQRSELISCLCTERTLMSEPFQDWAEALKEARGHHHRKVWEWCFIAQALKERGLLNEGKIGLGFAVGQEPLSAMFASLGARVVATDLCTAEAQAVGWVETGQHAEGFEAINSRGICDSKVLSERVEFKFADMNQISRDYDNKFDFTWSSCALEHLGSLEHGKQFIYNSIRCLKPGGVAVHTTEFNLSSNTKTVDRGETVLYRRRDIADIVKTLQLGGNEIEVDWDQGNGFADGFIDVPPYSHRTHLKIAIGKYTVTSIGLIIKKPS